MQPVVSRSNQPFETVSGLIERVTFFNEDTGFAVLRVQVKGHRELITVVGVLPSVSAGEWLTAEGGWVRDKQHGLQFRATALRSAAPTTRAGIEKYLGSGLISGIGAVYAKKLVETFGEGVFDIIENCSARLEEVDGIGPARRRRIKAAWEEQKEIRAIMVFLHSHGVTTSRAVRIFKTYGEQSVDLIRADPYRLARDIPGIGFRTADQIAQKVGIPPDSLLRARAGLTYTLHEQLDAGHCALPRTLLLEKAAAILQVSEMIVAEALQSLLAERALVLEEFADQTLVFLPSIQQAEQSVAWRVRERAANRVCYPPIDFEKAVAWCEERVRKRLAEGQREALRTAFNSKVVVITGGPGVGKTTLLRSLLLVLHAKKVRILLCAPTGRAAQRMSESTGFEAKTIHRLLEVQPGRAGFARNERHPLECDLLVVDEASMIDVVLMHQLLRAHPAGAGLILVGDTDQLPSVGPGTVLQDIIASGVVPVVRLTEVFRQAAESRITLAAHAINQGIMPEPGTKDQESDFYFIERDAPEEISRTLLDLVKTRITRKFGPEMASGIQVLSPMNRGSLGVRELNAILQAELNPVREGEAVVERFGCQFRVRDKVIQTSNNYDKEVFNGDIGIVSRVDLEIGILKVKFDQREVEYLFGELDELALAYAITIHKSQGSEFPVVIIPVASQHYVMLQRNLIYTALTRGRKLVVMIGQRKALGMAVRNVNPQRRYSALLPRLRQLPEKEYRSEA